MPKTAPGRKPAIADRNRTAAIDNIKAKITCLENWINDGIPYIAAVTGELTLNDAGRRQLDYFPSTLRQFNFWDGSQNCEKTRANLPELRRNANETLRGQAALRRNVEAVLKALSKRSASQRGEERPEQIAGIQRQLDVERMRTQTLGAELIIFRTRLKSLETENVRINEINTQLSAEAHRAISALEAEVTRLNAEVSGLNKKLLKLIPIKKV